jgi:hypothetical protein
MERRFRLRLPQRDTKVQYTLLPLFLAQTFWSTNVTPLFLVPGILEYQCHASASYLCSWAQTFWSTNVQCTLLPASVLGPRHSGVRMSRFCLLLCSWSQAFWSTNVTLLPPTSVLGPRHSGVPRYSTGFCLLPLFLVPGISGVPMSRLCSWSQTFCSTKVQCTLLPPTSVLGPGHSWLEYTLLPFLVPDILGHHASASCSPKVSVLGPLPSPPSRRSWLLL